MRFLVEERWGGAALFIVLHTLDYYLTLWSIVIHRAGADQRFDVGGSLELNPVMHGALERRGRTSWRFVMTLVGVAALLWLIQPSLTAADPELWPFVLGTILFTRLSVIGHHVHNIFFLRGIARGEIKGQLVYPRKNALALSALRYGAEALTLVVAASLSGSPWLWGGALALSALVLMLIVRAAWEWLRARKRSP